MRRAATVLCALAVGAGTAGCGADEPSAGATEALPRKDRLVDFKQKPPFVHGLSVDPRDGSFLLTTNRGFWRISEDGKAISRIRGRITAGRRASAVGTFLEVAIEEPGRLIGSGHPDERGRLPNFLGLIRSDDDGRTWRPVSRLGDADLHKIVLRHDRLYAFDAVLSAMLVSEDGGRTFSEEFTPRGLLIDFDVDPSEPDRIVGSTENELFRTEDGGRTWRPLQAAEGIRLAWPAPDALYRADIDGVVQVSANAGGTWQDVGRVGGEPYKIEAVDRERLFMALSDGTILKTTNGARTWDIVFRP